PHPAPLRREDRRRVGPPPQLTRRCQDRSPFGQRPLPGRTAVPPGREQPPRRPGGQQQPPHPPERPRGLEHRPRTVKKENLPPDESGGRVMDDMATNNFVHRESAAEPVNERPPDRDLPDAQAEPITKPLPAPFVPSITFEQARAIWRAIESFPDDGEEEGEDVD